MRLHVLEMTDEQKIDALITELEEIKFGVWMKDIFGHDTIDANMQHCLTTARRYTITNGLKNLGRNDHV